MPELALAPLLAHPGHWFVWILYAIPVLAVLAVIAFNSRKQGGLPAGEDELGTEDEPFELDLDEPER